MKLHRLYSNNPEKFQPIIFNDGLNVIFGDETRSDDRKEHENGIGKTAILQLIDYLLVKEYSNSAIKEKLGDHLQGWEFYLVIKKSDNEYLTIKRTIPDTKVSIALDTSGDADYIDSDDKDFWNYYLVGQKKAKTIIDNYFSFNVMSDFLYRDFIKYIIRTQDDYGDVFNMWVKARKSDSSWKPYLYGLLGFNVNNLNKKYEIDDEIKKMQIDVKKLQESIGKRDFEEEKALKDTILKERDLILCSIENKPFENFSLDSKNIKKLVNNVEQKIKELNKNKFLIEQKIVEIETTFREGKIPDFQEKRISKFLKELSLLQSDLKGELKDNHLFQKRLVEDRNIVLKKNLQKYTGDLISINNRLIFLDKEKSNLLKKLQESDFFKKYQQKSSEVLKIEQEIINIDNKLEHFHQIDKKEKKIESLKLDQDYYINEMKTEVSDKYPDIFANIKDKFQEIYNNIYMKDKLNFFVKINKEGNPEFKCKTVAEKTYQNTSESEGFTATRLQCFAFVLSIMIEYHKEDFFKFTIQDGIIEGGWGTISKTKFIEEVRKICDKYGIQYIFTIIKSDLPNDDFITVDEKVLTLSAENPLFGFKF